MSAPSKRMPEHDPADDGRRREAAAIRGAVCSLTFAALWALVAFAAPASAAAPHGGGGSESTSSGSAGGGAGGGGGGGGGWAVVAPRPPRRADAPHARAALGPAGTPTPPSH